MTGVGVKVCVLSDGVDSLAASQAAGELPAVDVLPGQDGARRRGHGDARDRPRPRARTRSWASRPRLHRRREFADNIRALRFQAGCDVIVDDILYFNESPFQDGIIAQAVNDVTADGALYFSSAGNEGNTLDGTSGNYEGDFVDSGRGVGKFAGAAHDFDPGPAVQVFEPISDDSSAGVPVTLFWADPLGARRRRLRPLPVRRRRQRRRLLPGRPGRQRRPVRDPRHAAFGGSGLRLAVVRFAGAARYFQLSALRGRFSDSATA